MRRVYIFILAVAAVWQLAGAALAAEFRLNNGDIIRGEPASFNEDGASFRLDVGGFSPRVTWGKFTQEALKELAKNKQAAKFAEPFIEVPIEVKQKEKAKKKEIVIKPVPRVEREAARKRSAFAGFGTPVGLAVLAMLMLANLYGAYEVAVFRSRPPLLVCGVSLLLPGIGPILFLSLPGLDQPVSTHEHPAPAATEVASTSMAQVPGMAPAGLGLASHDKPPPSGGAMEMATYKRGDTTFNRRFFESKLPGFFRIVPSEAEKDLVLVVRTPKHEYIAKRISRISSNEMHLQLLRGNTEASASFGEIIEVQVRHKDAKA